MLKIRLQRIGRRNDPTFRIVVVDSHQGPKSGKAVETVGSYNPRTKLRNIHAERIRHWIDRGAQASATVHNMLVDERVLDSAKVNVLPRKASVAEGVVEEAPPEPASEEGADETAGEEEKETSDAA